MFFICQAELPTDKPRLLPGVMTPSNILTAGELGFDIVESTYPYMVTERGCALVFNYALPIQCKIPDEIDSTHKDQLCTYELDLKQAW